MTIFFTGKGDRGQSAMGAKKIAKDDPLFAALGSLDELNSWLGLCRVSTKGQNKITKILLAIQEDLFIMQAEIGLLAMGRKAKVKLQKEKIKFLEIEIATIDKIIPPIKNFIIPGGSQFSAQLDVARALARRVERDFVAYNRRHKINPEILQYLNRLSSLLFALARWVNFRLNVREANPKYK